MRNSQKNLDLFDSVIINPPLGESDQTSPSRHTLEVFTLRKKAERPLYYPGPVGQRFRIVDSRPNLSFSAIVNIGLHRYYLNTIAPLAGKSNRFSPREAWGAAPLPWGSQEADQTWPHMEQ